MYALELISIVFVLFLSENNVYTERSDYPRMKELTIRWHVGLDNVRYGVMKTKIFMLCHEEKQGASNWKEAAQSSWL